ncbi:leucine-rich repeat-containing protein 23 isoform X2 [Electrophorus electricus]|uniref:leucine-rich repeat-containing protein 23 isoform X2 n=1 Tax=Electrophorus electricus TaxID=8005 RepID=UPI0015CFAAFF|nr:leucine-rich repeat-containing protein 23 isoform X2 [Electrophorus electricus]
MSVFDEDDVLHGESEGEGQKEGQEEDATCEEKQIEPCSLTQDMIVPGLSLLCRTGNGLAHAFVKLDIKDRHLTDIVLLRSFIHLRFLDISSNYLSDLSPLAALTQLLWLKGDGNRIEGFQGQPLGNGIQRMAGLECQSLTNLVTLELRGNRLETTDGIYLPNLRCLYLAQNRITKLEGLEKLERLTTLHLRDNQLETLDGINLSMNSLQYLNVRGNLVFSLQALQSLMAVAQTLRTLVLVENPLSETDDYRLCVLTYLPLLERLDKEPVSPGERSEAQERMKEFQDSREQEDQHT